MKTSVLKPGYLVSLKSALKGGVTYRRIDIETEHTDDAGALVARWETEREIPDPDEFNRATIARNKARLVVASVCCPSSFGLLCPISKEGELFDAIAEARKIAAEHNETTTRTRVDIYALVGRVAQDDAEAARAIGAEIRDLLEQMAAGIKNADPAAIREAANKARGIGGMLSADVAGQVSAAIIEAREAARAIVRRVEKAGETAATVVSQMSVQRIEAARFSFLDLDESTAEVKTEAPAARGLDLPATDDYETRVRELETEGLTRSDAQGVADAETMKQASTGAVRELELF